MTTDEAARNLLQHVEQAVEAVQYGHTKSALYKTADIRDALTELATELVADGVHAGLSQAEMARYMDVPASVLAGAKREFARP